MLTNWLADMLIGLRSWSFLAIDILGSRAYDIASTKVLAFFKRSAKC